MVYQTTFSVRLGNRKIVIVPVQFESEESFGDYEVDGFDDCRPKIQAWLDKHYPGETIETDGEDIEHDGSPATIDDVIIF